MTKVGRIKSVQSYLTLALNLTSPIVHASKYSRL